MLTLPTTITVKLAQIAYSSDEVYESDIILYVTPTFNKGNFNDETQADSFFCSSVTVQPGDALKKLIRKKLLLLHGTTLKMKKVSFQSFAQWEIVELPPY